MSAGRATHAADPPRARAERELVEAVLRAIAGLRYGSIEIVVHDSKVVQIERREKLRLTGRDEER